MRDLRGNDIGQAVDFRDQGPAHQAAHPWPAETIVSAGKGVVFVTNPKEGQEKTYMTLFMEVYPPDVSFIRGQGVSFQECEDAAWDKYQLALKCLDGSGIHDWQPRKHRNGAGFCSRCNTFKSGVFTPEEVAAFDPVEEKPSGILDGLVDALEKRAQQRGSKNTSLLEDLRNSVENPAPKTEIPE